MPNTLDEPTDDDMQQEYDFSKGVRGLYAERFKGMVRAVALEADVAEVFQTSQQVNQALRWIIELNKATGALLDLENVPTPEHMLAEPRVHYKADK